MDKENVVNNLTESFIEKVKNMIDVDTVIGTPFETKEGTVIIPITKVSVGFVSGGGEYGCDKKIIKTVNKMPLAGGGAGGVSILPIGFLEVKGKDCKLLKIDEKSVYQNVLDKLPGILDSVSKIIERSKKDD